MSGRATVLRVRSARFAVTFAILATGPVVAAPSIRAQTDASPVPAVEAFLVEGQYDEAIAALEGAYARNRTPAVGSALASVLLEIGRYDRAETVLREGVAAAPANAELRLLLGRALMERGRLDEADREFAAIAGAPRGGPQLLARVRRGEILLRRGDYQGANALFDGFIDIYNENRDLDTREIQAVAEAVRHLGVADPVLYQDALRAYDEAVAADPTNLDAHMGIGALFLDRFNGAEAQTAFQEVLRARPRHPMARLGIAQAQELQATGELDVGAIVEDVLTLNPNLVGALVMRAEQRLAIEDGEGAEADLRAALAVDPTAKDALAVLAASYFIRGMIPEYEEIRDRALAINPRDSGFFVVVSDIASTVRLYSEAAELANEGVALDSLSWNAYGVRGLNELRLGRMGEGRVSLETAFEGDPYNPWIKNTLDLLDHIDEFEEWPAEHVNVFLHPEDGGALAIYMTQIADRAYEVLSARYRFRPTTPIRIEAFRRSADFSVRTMGLTGLGALGVAFGPVVAMDSPAARGPGGYEWASTLWHELTHVVHLGMTNHRMPRWLAEGLAVHEERLAGMGWGMRPSLSFLAAYREEEIRPPSELSLSFVRPRSAEEIGHAYIQASLVAAWIEETEGFDAILDMIRDYGDGRGPEEVTERVLGMTMEEMDRAYDAWFRGRYAQGLLAAQAAAELRALPPERLPRDRAALEQRVVSEPMDVESRVALARLLLEEEEYAEAIPLLLQARELFPENPDPGGPNRLLYEAYRAQTDPVAAEAALVEHLTYVTGDYGSFLNLADIRERNGDPAGAAEALERAMWVYPFDVPQHDRLARLFRTTGDTEGEVRERKVALALEPADRAGAWYRLAEAEYRAGAMGDARASVLRALEEAPRYPEAQDLLLLILGAGNAR